MHQVHTFLIQYPYFIHTPSLHLISLSYTRKTLQVRMIILNELYSVCKNIEELYSAFIRLFFYFDSI